MVSSRFCDLSKENLNLIKADLNGEIPLDITIVESVENFFKNHNFKYIILFSAFTDVDNAEKQRGKKDQLCWQINVKGSLNIIKLCKKFSKKLIFISTDFVFDGKNGPYSEDEKSYGESSKISWYGLSKIEAEKNCQNNLKDYLIVRISYPYRANFPAKLDFARSILEKAQTNSLYPMFSDQIITPTFVDDLSEAIEILIKKNQIGIFNIASPTTTTPYDFAVNLLKTFKTKSKVEKGSLINYLKNHESTPRPINGGLKTKKIENLGFTPTNWQLGIQKMYEQLKETLI